MNSIEKEFVPYQEALELKELGFDEPCFTFYPKEDTIGFNGKYHSIKEGYKNSTVNAIWIKKYKRDFECVTAPTYSQAFRWFREKYDLRTHFPSNNPANFEYVILTSNNLFKNDEFENNEVFLNQEEAELACLRKLIEIVKGKS